MRLRLHIILMIFRTCLAATELKKLQSHSLIFFSVIIMVEVFALFSLNLSTVSRTAFISVLHAVKLGPSSY